MILLLSNDFSMIIGLVLGDANLQRRSDTSYTRLHFTQSKKYYEFFLDVFNRLSYLCTNNYNPIPKNRY